MAECKIKVFGIVGPTASGKTSLAVEVCKRLGGEVVSCDSMQIYKGMDIATAKPTPEEMCGIPHHLIGFLDPTESYSVARYCEDAKKAIEEISSAGRVPVLAGGTGLYYSSLADNIVFFEEEADLEYRRFLFERAEKEGAKALYDELLEADPERAQALHINDLNRIIRALEILHTTGKSITLQNKESKLIESPFEFRTVCLDAKDRQFLYDRINARVDIMMENGLLEEAERFLHSDIGNTAVQAIGYKELRPYFDGTATLDECIDNLKMQTRRYAKRQLTWFRRDERIKTLYIDEVTSFDELAGEAIRFFTGESYEQ